MLLKKKIIELYPYQQIQFFTKDQIIIFSKYLDKYLHSKLYINNNL